MTLRDARSAAARLPVQDLDRAREWYAEKLGLEPVEERPGGLRYVVNGAEFGLFLSQGASAGSFTQYGFWVDDLATEVAEMKSRGVVFEEYDVPGLQTTNSIAHIEGNYPSKGSAELAAWFKDSEGNLLGIGQALP